METNKIIQGNCLDVMKIFPDNSIDTIITDPPYGLSFMGKKWDYDVPKVELWQEALRVLKPGGTALIFAGSRTQHRMACAVEDAGFILKDCMLWIFGSGFPKATDISKQLDKGHKRKVVGYKKRPEDNSKRTLRAKNNWIKGGTDITQQPITEPATSEAKLWNGWKSHGLKPAYEPIIVAMKPNDGTYANNAIKHGVAGLNIDGGRIPCNDKPKFPEGKYDQNTDIKWRTDKRNKDTQPQGRFPANIILDEEAAELLDEQSGELSVAGNIREAKINDYNASSYKAGIGKRNPKYHNDKGGASRFFYVAKASKSERNMGCEELDNKQVNDGRKDQTSIDCPQQRGITYRHNFHPTVKPLKLMEYLCILTKTPTGGIVLDPFTGSGTTCMACKKTGRPFIGIEQDKEYCKIAEARIKATQIDNKLF